MKTIITPSQAAQALRVGFEAMIPKTWRDYFDTSKPWLTAYEFGRLVQEQVRCSFVDAASAVEDTVPELFAEHWDNLPQPAAA